MASHEFEAGAEVCVERRQPRGEPLLKGWPGKGHRLLAFVALCTQTALRRAPGGSLTGRVSSAHEEGCAHAGSAAQGCMGDQQSTLMHSPATPSRPPHLSHQEF